MAISNKNLITRRAIRIDSDNTLANVPTNRYAPFFGQRILGSDGYATTALTEEDMSLTGANPPYLPMSFMIPDRNGKRLSFSLLINPNSVNHGKTSAMYTNYTRDGYNNQLWGPNQDLITSTGVTAAFMSPIMGLTAVGRRRTAAYVNLMALVAAYRNNGYTFAYTQSDLPPLPRIITMIYGVELYYDGQTFMGHFNNFTLDESADRPYLFDYSFEFVVSSLTNDYSEVRGHFRQIGQSTDQFIKLSNQVTSKKISESGMSSETRDDVRSAYDKLAFLERPE